MTRILVVEDEVSFSDPLSYLLRKEGYDVAVAETGPDALSEFEAAAADLVVLDLMLPGFDGVEVCRQLRSFTDAYVIMLTARDDLVDRVAGLEIGADDYMVKPFAFSELVARMHALLRRAHGGDNFRLRVHDLEVDLIGRRVVRGGKEIELTEREFALLEYLVRNTGRTISRDTLAREVWRETSRVTPIDNVIDVHVSHLRDKVDEGHPVRLIQTVRGIGFMVKGP